MIQKINRTQKSRYYSFFSVVDPDLHRHIKTHHHHAHTHTSVHTPSLCFYIGRCESKKQTGEGRAIYLGRNRGSQLTAVSISAGTSLRKGVRVEHLSIHYLPRIPAFAVFQATSSKDLFPDNMENSTLSFRRFNFYSVWPSAPLPPSIYLSICLSVHLSICSVHILSSTFVLKGKQAACFWTFQFKICHLNPHDTCLLLCCDLLQSEAHLPGEKGVT